MEAPEVMAAAMTARATLAMAGIAVTARAAMLVEAMAMAMVAVSTAGAMPAMAGRAVAVRVLDTAGLSTQGACHICIHCQYRAYRRARDPTRYTVQLSART